MNDDELRLQCLRLAVDQRMRGSALEKEAEKYYTFCKSGQAPTQCGVPVTSGESAATDPVQESLVPPSGGEADENQKQRRKRRTKAEMETARAQAG